MTKSRIRYACGLLLVLATIPAAAQPDPAPAGPDWLIVVQGTVLSVSAAELVLSTAPQAVAFTDRPFRQAIIVDLPALIVGSWGPDGDFRADPPNASLIDEDNGQIAVIEIIDAAWSTDGLAMTIATLEGTLPVAGDSVGLTIDRCNIFNFACISRHMPPPPDLPAVPADAPATPPADQPPFTPPPGYVCSQEGAVITCQPVPPDGGDIGGTPTTSYDAGSATRQ